ncbi:MAG TPA: MTH938/NDUFAF3 family protein [Caulobacteraceae bacterium]|nr:MTH938/NDUFAF3 family protein [Caulobacteraceae bacterium]
MREPASIDAFGGGGFRVSGVWRPGSLLILDDAPADWPVAVLAELEPAHLDAVISAGRAMSEFVLLGTGVTQALPPKSVREALRAAGLGLEFMSTEAAARMHNVLAQQGRRFATALIAI